VNIQQLTKKVVEAVKTREAYHCDSAEYEKADEAVNKLLTQVKSEDIKEFNKLYNQPENWRV
jgi:hypothetical protein